MKYATIIDIAKELGISKSTVSRALRGDNQNVSKETQAKILEVAQRLGYKRNELAVNLTYIIHSGFISGYQNRYGDNLKPPTNVYHRMTA